VSQFAINFTVWAVGWLGMFCALEGPAAFWPRCPWDTFSRFVWDAQARWDFLTVAVVAIIGILASHLIRFRGIEEGDRKTVKQAVVEAKIIHAHKVLAKHQPNVVGA